MKKRKICVVIASRVHYGRLKPVLEAIKQHPNLELQLVVGASALLERYGNITQMIQQDGFTINETFHMILEGENPITMAKSTGLGILELSTIFANLKPDVIFTHADRFETLATAIAASYMNIPLVHNQGGEVTGSIDESVRHAVTKLAHVHTTTNAETSQRLIKMGEDPKTVFITGCPSIDLAKGTDLSVTKNVLMNYKGVGNSIDITQPYLVVLQHPVTTEYGNGLQQINQTLQAINELKMPTIWLWPNVDAGSDEISKGIRLFREQHDPPFVYFLKNMHPEDYLKLIANASCCVGNSSSFIREGSFLGTPAVIIGTRQQGRTKAKNVVEVDYDKQQILDAVQAQIRHGKFPSDTMYGEGNASKKIADILATCRVNIQKRIQY
ncbi:UDP-N-acetylglucosamine 2-epimerase (hydrolyzing) [Candidatus Woesearchaeota archaeon]|nr:MAG: UDP-N-acetylglucosamine 2-epimerase (hydrolyzing) [Candidatus Woesearchaeota archaeon]